MRRAGRHHVVILILVSLAIAGLSIATAGVQATLLTNKGQITSGSLYGIASVIRLSAPDEVSIIGPDRQFDVPLSSIIQITLDFPRVVIEATDGVLIGPYSAFIGIDEALRIESSSGSVLTIPTASLRAIALSGHTLRPVPREWMGDRFLSEPEILAASSLTLSELEAECENCTITIPQTLVDTTDDDEVLVWNTIEPQAVVEEESTGFPWWLGLLLFGAMIAVSLLLL